MSFDLRHIVAICAVVLLGLLFGAGLSMYTSRGLLEASWTLGFQLEDALFAKIMPPFFWAALIALVATTFLTQGVSRWSFAVASELMVAVMAITIGFEVPNNTQVQLWKAGAAPANWQALRDRWLWNHLYRTIAGAMALLCAASGLSNL
jgi:hypothetical protein